MRGVELAVLILLSLGMPVSVSAADVIPHAQDKPPNAPRDAETAARLMTVPEGFVVDVVACEPNLINPVAMAIDEQGRFWITESVEYPRRSAGPGKDRVKVLEDTDGDGKMDKFSIFLDGLNIPSGVQVGYGGVWIANAPDILFVPDADRDGIADGEPQVVVTGFGRTDTHELPNSLTWGPDGWLYGLNGVFNHSHVKYPASNPNYQKQHPGWQFTCAMFRIHPRTREFQVFCEGTSNPWGIAFNHEGDAFVSACVIDHLWHLVETGYYHRQGGPYPPHTWKIDSIVKHKHQKAAYCGITWFDSDAYPEAYRKKLYMGNIHGGCINVDRIERQGSTYAGFGEPDFLTANDAWFMPVVQKTGPDGCLYILDWYDRYHCYQDANRDPAGIDRLKGRLYRVRYTQGPTAASRRPSPPVDLALESDEQLIERLAHPNVWVRDTAQRLLTERNSDHGVSLLAKVLADEGQPLERRLRAMWVLGAIPPAAHSVVSWHRHVLDLADQLRSQGRSAEAALFAAWAVRLAGDRQESAEALAPDGLETLIRTAEPPVLLQLAIFLGKTRFAENRVRCWLEILRRAGDDPLLPRIVWQNLHPYLEQHGAELLAALRSEELLRATNVAALLPRIIDRLLAREPFEAPVIQELVGLVCQRHPEIGRQVLQALAAKIQSGELKGEPLAQLKTALAETLHPLLDRDSAHPLQLEASLLAVSWQDPAGFAAARDVLESSRFTTDQRLAAAHALVAAGQRDVLASIARIFAQSPPAAAEFRGKLLATLARLDVPGVDEFVLRSYAQLEPELQPQAIELLTQRPQWAVALLTAIGEKQLPPTVLSVNQARKLHETKDERIRELLARHWGQVREGRSPDRDRVIAEMRTFIRNNKGDAFAGEAVFKKVCAQCHKIYGEGQEVGPDITLNGRNDYAQLLSNVFDPSLVIGAGYRTYTVATEDGRVINGLLVEDSAQRIVLKVQGGKQEVIPRDAIEEFRVSETSLMPEQLERQLAPTEIADLFAYITLDRPPRDPAAKRLPGVYEVVPRESTNPGEFSAIFQEVGPGFSQVTSGEGGVALLAEHMGRAGVVRTHPVSRDRPAEISGTFAIPAGKKTTLVVEVAHDPRGDWRLVAAAGDSGRLIDEMISKDTCRDGWATFQVDISRYAGQQIPIRLWNQANDWHYEFAYWGRVRLVSE